MVSLKGRGRERWNPALRKNQRREGRGTRLCLERQKSRGTRHPIVSRGTGKAGHPVSDRVYKLSLLSSHLRRELLALVLAVAKQRDQTMSAFDFSIRKHDLPVFHF